MYKSYCKSPIGLIEIRANDSGLLVVTFLNEEGQTADAPSNAITEKTASQLNEYFAGTRTIFNVPLAPLGTPFQQQVWTELLRIPFGKTDSYSAIAQKLNNPLSVRAVGTANGRNPIAVIIPCHRVIGASGHLTGYAGGLWRKEFLLDLENASHSKQIKLW
jgi:methylated-DNA-[protein]-cysteine S-methyltransferase